MTTTAPPTPDLNHTAAALIDALDDMTDLPEFRHGLRKSIGYWSLMADADKNDHRPAVELIAAWRALDNLAAAVAARKGTTHG